MHTIILDRVLSTAESYDVNSNTWSYIAIMSTPRFAATAAVLGNKCYVAGGLTSDEDFLPDRELDIVECYEPGSNRLLCYSGLLAYISQKASRTPRAVLRFIL